MQTDDSNWATIAEAARRLGISPRQVRRYADRLLGTEDRTPLGTVPVRVLISAVLRVKNEIAERGHQLGTEDRTHRDTTRDSVLSSVPSQGATPPLHETALVTQLQSEIEFLRSELTAQREAHQTSETERQTEAAELRRLWLMDKQELTELRQRVALIEAPQSDTGEPPEGAQKPTSGGWWARLFGKGKG